MPSTSIQYRAQYTLGKYSSDVPITPVSLAIFLLLSVMRPPLTRVILSSIVFSK